MAEEMCWQGTTLRRYQTWSKTRKEGLKSYADMAIYAYRPS